MTFLVQLRESKKVRWLSDAGVMTVQATISLTVLLIKPIWPLVVWAFLRIELLRSRK